MRGSEIQNLDRCDGSNNNHSTTQEQSLSTTLIMNRQLLRQKVRQKISVIKTNTFVFVVVFKTKHESKWQNQLFL